MGRDTLRHEHGGGRVYDRSAGPAVAAGDTPCQVKDTLTNLGAGSNPADFIGFRGEVYLRATTVTEGSWPWKTDGSEAGLQLLAETPSAVV